MTPTPKEYLGLYVRLLMAAGIILGAAWLLEVAPVIGWPIIIGLCVLGLFARVIDDLLSQPPPPDNKDRKP